MNVDPAAPGAEDTVGHAESARGTDRSLEGARVLQVIGGSVLGGVAPVVSDICEVCVALGLRPTILATEHRTVAFLRDRGWDVWEFPGIVRSPRPVHDLLTAVRLAREIRSRGIGIVHTHTSKGGMVGRLAARLAGCPVVIHHTHGFYHAGMPPGLSRAAMVVLEGFFARLDDIQVLINKFELEDAVRRRIVPGRKARLIFNGIRDPAAAAPPERASIRERWGIPPNDVVIGTVARLALEQKAVDRSIQAFADVARDRSDLWYVLLGEGEDRDCLERQVRALGLGGRVLMPGFVSDAGRLVSAFDMVVSSSRREGLSISLLEAMAWAKPIVASDIPANADLIVDEETGLLFPVDDIQAMARAMSRLLDDAPLAARIGRAARVRYETHFDHERFMEAIERLYMDALSDRRGR